MLKSIKDLVLVLLVVSIVILFVLLMIKVQGFKDCESSPQKDMLHALPMSFQTHFVIFVLEIGGLALNLNKNIYLSETQQTLSKTDFKKIESYEDDKITTIHFFENCIIILCI